VFERGFPSRCTLWASKTGFRKLIGDPAWATVEQVTFYGGFSDVVMMEKDIVRFLEHASLRSLRRLYNILPHTFVRLTRPLSAVQLTAQGSEGDFQAAIDRLAAMTSLTEVGLDTSSQNLPFGNRLLADSRLAHVPSFRTYWGEPLGVWHQLIERSWPRRWECVNLAHRYVFDRDEDGHLSRLKVSWDPRFRYDAQAVIRALESLDPLALTDVSFGDTEDSDRLPPEQPDPGEIGRVTDVVRRFTRGKRV
jgi:hypothetical protein